MAKKSIKKETIEAKINKQVENIENDSNKIDISENIISIENIKDSINEVDVNIEHELDENIKALSEEMDEILAPVKDIADKISDIAKKGEELDSILSGSTPEEIQSYINNEIKNTEELIKKVETIKETINTNPKWGSVTNWWNGMGYDL